MDFIEATLKDAESILALQKLAYKQEAELHNDFDIPPLTQSLDELLTDFEHKTVLKVELDGQLVASGQVSLENGCAFIGRMAVKPEYQGKGIGSRLMAALESVFPNATRFELFTGEKSQRNLDMYERRGYVRTHSKYLGKTRVIFLSKTRPVARPL